jgi:hypothetical protein
MTRPVVKHRLRLNWASRYFQKRQGALLRLLNLLIKVIEPKVVLRLQVAHAIFPTLTHEIGYNLVIVVIEFEQTVEILGYACQAVAFRYDRNPQPDHVGKDYLCGSFVVLHGHRLNLQSSAGQHDYLAGVSDTHLLVQKRPRSDTANEVRDWGASQGPISSYMNILRLTKFYQAFLGKVRVEFDLIDNRMYLADAQKPSQFRRREI